MGKIISYRDLMVWQKAMQLVTAVYRLTQGFPKSRSSKKEFQYFLLTVRGSLWELETQILLSKSLGYLKEDERSASRSFRRSGQITLWLVDCIEKMIPGVFSPSNYSLSTVTINCSQ